MPGVVGDENRNRQKLLAKTVACGTDHLQYSWIVELDCQFRGIAYYPELKGKSAGCSRPDRCCDRNSHTHSINDYFHTFDTKNASQDFLGQGLCR